MASIDRPTAGGNSGPIALRTEVAPMPGPAVGPLGYSFDAVPRRIRHNPRLKPVDAQVVAILIGFAVWRRDSCWASVASIASRLPAMRTGRGGSRSACDRTVQRSIDRLKAEGELRHERVPKPDPDDPRNRTGWRFYFNWAAPAEPPGEVTKGPTGVTKPGGEVTKESGDSLVTQGRLEVLEQDSTTFNVAALASGGEEAVRIPVSLPTSNRLPGPDASAPDPSPPAPLWSDAELAEKLIRMVRAGGCDLKVEMDPERGEVIRPTRALAPEVIARLKRLRPHVLAYLKRRPGDSARPAIVPAEDAPAPDRPAARVREAGPVRALIGTLRGHPDGEAAELATGQAIAAAIGDGKPKSVETFAWYAGEVRRGDMPLDWLMTAFERACGRKARNRGKVLVATIQQLKDERTGGRGRPPAEGSPC